MRRLFMGFDSAWVTDAVEAKCVSIRLKEARAQTTSARRGRSRNAHSPESAWARKVAPRWVSRAEMPTLSRWVERNQTQALERKPIPIISSPEVGGNHTLATFSRRRDWRDFRRLAPDRFPTADAFLEHDRVSELTAEGLSLEHAAGGGHTGGHHG